MNANLNILIIDNSAPTLSKIEERIKHLGFNLWCTATPDRQVNELATLNPNLVILGPSLDTETALKCVHKLKIIDPVLPILTSCSDICLSGGAAAAPFDGVHYIGTDLNTNEISKAIETALKHRDESSSRPNFQLLIGQGQEIATIREKIQNVSKRDITVLITGETGTGKELIARSIHFHSLRSEGPLVKINCGALPDELLESEVFGFQRGAFTDAHKDKPGRLEMAHNGTLFIDEIGNLSLTLQVKFLQVLEEKIFSRLGGTEEKVIDTRVVAATNSDLQKLVREGTFRKDLFYRLNIIHINSPPLRERKDDLLFLVHYFMNKYCFEFKKEPLEVSENVKNLFMEYQWPGNVRELENVIRLAIILRDWSFAFKELNVGRLVNKDGQQPFAYTGSSHMNWNDTKVKEYFSNSDFSLKKISKEYVSEAERQAILDALKETQWNRKKAAQLLKVSYKTLLNRINEFDLRP